MDNPTIVNIVITTTYKRGSRALGCDNFVSKCIESILDNTIIPYRLIIVMDDNPDSIDYLDSFLLDNLKEYAFIMHPKQGVAAALDAGWFYAEMLNIFHGDTKYFCYIQDDTIVAKKGWLQELFLVYETMNKRDEEDEGEDIGFFTGHDAPEHNVLEHHKVLGIDFKYKKFIRATNIIGTTKFWRTIMPIPRHNPAGDLRGFPTPNPKGGRGKGSNIDVFLTGGNSAGFVSQDASPNCSFSQGKVCMVIPGLVKHMATDAASSTWGNPNKEYHA